MSLEWRTDIGPEEWDETLARLGGHPFQSALWGAAQQAEHGTRQHRWMGLQGREPVYLLRFEERRTPLGTVAWAPRGPAVVGFSYDRKCRGVEDEGVYRARHRPVAQSG